MAATDTADAVRAPAPALLPCVIRGSGMALPEQAVTSAALDARLHHTPGYSEKRSGVQCRYLADDWLHQGALGARALLRALEQAGLGVDALDLVLGACGVPEQALPSTAVFIAHEAGLPAGTPAFDVNASCLSFLVALRLAASLLAEGQYRRIAVVAADLASRGVDWNNPEASLIFGDGAAAVVLEHGSGQQGVAAFDYASYPEGRRLCQIRGGGTAHNPRTGVLPADYLFQMDGKGVFRLAAAHMERFVAGLLARAGLTLEQVDLVVPHQASHLGLEHMRKQLGIAPERLMNIYPQYGNQVAASIATALHLARVQGRAAPGQRLLLLGTAAGLSLGGLVLTL